MPAVVTVGFEAGEPVSLDGEPMEPVQLIETLNAIAGEHGVGRADIVEDRLVGMKSRGVYETPGGHGALPGPPGAGAAGPGPPHAWRWPTTSARRYADLVYDGRWWTPEREALDALVNVDAAVRHRGPCG